MKVDMPKDFACKITRKAGKKWTVKNERNTSDLNLRAEIIS